MKRQLYQDVTGPEADFQENLHLGTWDEGLSAVLAESTVFLDIGAIWFDDKGRIRNWPSGSRVIIKPKFHMRSNQLVFLKCRNSQGTSQH